MPIATAAPEPGPGIAPEGIGANARAPLVDPYIAAMKWGNTPWPWRYALVPALAAAMLTGILLLAAHWLLVDELARRSLLRAQHRAATLAQQLDAQMRSAQRELRLMARSQRLTGAPADVAAELELLRRQSTNFVWIGLVSPDGIVRAATQGWLEGQSIASRPVFRQALKGSFVGDAHRAVALAELMSCSRSSASSPVARPRGPSSTASAFCRKRFLMCQVSPPSSKVMAISGATSSPKGRNDWMRSLFEP